MLQGWVPLGFPCAEDAKQIPSKPALSERGPFYTSELRAPFLRLITFPHSWKPNLKLLSKMNKSLVRSERLESNGFVAVPHLKIMSKQREAWRLCQQFNSTFEGNFAG